MYFPPEWISRRCPALPDADINDFFRSVTKYLKRIYTCKKPVIAAVGGIALGGGFNLATVCDLIIASESAIFGHPELMFGLNPLVQSAPADRRGIKGKGDHNVRSANRCQGGTADRSRQQGCPAGEIDGGGGVDGPGTGKEVTQSHRGHQKDLRYSAPP